MPAILDLAKRHYRRHTVAFAVTVPVLTIVMIFAAWWWLFWPLMVWLFAFAVHFLVVKSITVDPDWVDERTSSTAESAYDLSHIMSIRKRYDELSSRGRKRDEPEQDGKMRQDGAPDDR
jgi:hypothetical protein